MQRESSIPTEARTFASERCGRVRFVTLLLKPTTNSIENQFQFDRILHTFTCQVYKLPNILLFGHFFIMETFK